MEISDAAQKFFDAIGILACIGYLVWKFMPNNFLMPKDDERPLGKNPFKYDKDSDDGA